MRNNTILVTGGAGFIGFNFVNNWLNRSLGRIVNLDLLTYAGNKNNLKLLNDNENHIFVQGDINDKNLVSQLLLEFQPHAIINFAAESHVDRSIQTPGVFISTNINGTYNLLECTRNYWNNLKEKSGFRFIHISTDEVYGSLGEQEEQFTEVTAYMPNSPYSASKAASDHLVRAWYHTYGLPTIITNCSNNYGPFQYPEKLIPLIILNAINCNILPIYGDGKNIRDWLHVDDHCNAVDLIVRQGKIGEAYNIGGDNELTNLELAKKICQQMDDVNPENKPHEKLINFVEDRKGHDWRYAIDSSKICKELGWKPAQDFKALLKNTVEFLLEVV